MEAKAEAILRLASGKRLVKLGRSLALIIPKEWVTLYASQFTNDDIGIEYWVAFTQEGKRIVIEPLDRERVNALMEANNVRIH